ncbi:MAG: DUF4430 domain-containing protein [Candidatus Cohnella colombiensis]|uniref:DUF4430 domain-containing protein n=1 Tax=Candidatus Cohnella colombiensis TaxID=3121368 RepID=A0AA95JAG9_9BACL|nr:MAG: DUF4430 domain-containing protein [Cohnella sp.]
MSKFVKLLVVLVVSIMIAGCGKGTTSGEVMNEPVQTPSTAPNEILSDSELLSKDDRAEGGKAANLSEGDNETKSSDVDTQGRGDRTGESGDTAHLSEGDSETKSGNAATATPSTPHPAPPAASPKAEDSTRQTVTFSIVGNEEWGVILTPELLQLSEGDTVASVLIRAAKSHRLAFDIRGSGSLSYISGIDGLFEFDDGPTSGWKFDVNGVTSSIGAGSYELQPGDQVKWYYVSEDSLSPEEEGPQ